MYRGLALCILHSANSGLIGQCISETSREHDGTQEWVENVVFDESMKKATNEHPSLILSKFLRLEPITADSNELNRLVDRYGYGFLYNYQDEEFTFTEKRHIRGKYLYLDIQIDESGVIITYRDDNNEEEIRLGYESDEEELFLSDELEESPNIKKFLMRWNLDWYDYSAKELALSLIYALDDALTYQKSGKYIRDDENKIQQIIEQLDPEEKKVFKSSYWTPLHDIADEKIGQIIPGTHILAVADDYQVVKGLAEGKILFELLAPDDDSSYVKPMKPSECHNNVCTLIKTGKEVKMYTGYALSHNRRWLFHSWGVDDKGRVVETTVPRLAYIGIVEYDSKRLRAMGMI